MKPRKSVVFLMFFGLLLFAFAIGVAQDSKKSTNKKHAECCSATESCPMSQSEASGARKENCCQSESCNKKHDDKGCCCGDSCDMKSQHARNQHSGDATCCKAKHDAKSKSN